MNLPSKSHVKVIFVFFGLIFSSCAEECYQCTGASFGDKEYCEGELGKTSVTLAVNDYETVYNGSCSKK